MKMAPPMTKTVHIQYFAILREQRGASRETLQSAAATAGELYAELRARHGFSLPADRLRVAVDDEFTAWSTPLRDGAAVVFIPPVAGG
jgi:molybdopterin synthase sulfur carrier subunit